MSITIWRKLQNWMGWISSRAERKTVQPFVERLDIKAPSLNTAVASLSGGNQQKVSLAKWLAAGVSVLIIDEPTVGIDVRTKANLHELIWELVERGLGILLISSDMPEMVRLADRILVMRHGRITGEIRQRPRLRESQRADHGVHPLTGARSARSPPRRSLSGGAACP